MLQNLEQSDHAEGPNPSIHTGVFPDGLASARQCHIPVDFIGATLRSHETMARPQPHYQLAGSQKIYHYYYYFLKSVCVFCFQPSFASSHKRRQLKDGWFWGVFVGRGRCQARC